jgi:RNA polymerase sigma-70 factor (ECF subfamily)
MVRVSNGLCCGSSKVALVNAAREGDSWAWSSLIDMCTPSVRTIASRFERDTNRVEDIVQESWMAAIQRIVSLRDTSRFDPWLHAIVRNKCCTHIRNAVECKLLSEHERSEEWPANNDDPETEAIKAEEIALAKVKIAHGLDSLAEVYREAIVARYFDDLSYQEIAEANEIPVGTVKSRLFTAHVQLKRVLEEVA